MRISHDKKIDAKYIRLKKGKIESTKKVEDWLLLDCNKEGEVLGVEILDASKHYVGVHLIMGKFEGSNVNDFSSVRTSECVMSSKLQFGNLLAKSIFVPA